MHFSAPPLKRRCSHAEEFFIWRRTSLFFFSLGCRPNAELHQCFLFSPNSRLNNVWIVFVSSGPTSLFVRISDIPHSGSKTKESTCQNLQPLHTSSSVCMMASHNFYPVACQESKLLQQRFYHGAVPSWSQTDAVSSNRRGKKRSAGWSTK